MMELNAEASVVYVWLGYQLLNFHLIPCIWKLWHYKVARIYGRQDIAGILKDEVSISQLPYSLAQSIDDQHQCPAQFDNRSRRESEARSCSDGAIALSPLNISGLIKTFWILGHMQNLVRWRCLLIAQLPQGCCL